MPDQKWGEAVKAVVEFKVGKNATEDELKTFCKQSLGRLKTPKSIEAWEKLPRSAVGKVLKKEIREMYWQGHDRRI